MAAAEDLRRWASLPMVPRSPNRRDASISPSVPGAMTTNFLDLVDVAAGSADRMLATTGSMTGVSLAQALARGRPYIGLVPFRQGPPVQRRAPAAARAADR